MHSAYLDGKSVDPGADLGGGVCGGRSLLRVSTPCRLKGTPLCFGGAQKINLVDIKKSTKFSKICWKSAPLEKILDPPLGWPLALRVFLFKFPKKSDEIIVLGMVFFSV